MDKLSGIIGNLGIYQQPTERVEYKGDRNYNKDSFSSPYNASHPRVNDTPGIVNVSPVANCLDIIA